MRVSFSEMKPGMGSLTKPTLVESWVAFSTESCTVLLPGVHVSISTMSYL